MICNVYRLKSGIIPSCFLRLCTFGETRYLLYLCKADLWAAGYTPPSVFVFTCSPIPHPLLPPPPPNLLHSLSLCVHFLCWRRISVTFRRIQTVYLRKGQAGILHSCYILLQLLSMCGCVRQVWREKHAKWHRGRADEDTWSEIFPPLYVHPLYFCILLLYEPLSFFPSLVLLAAVPFPLSRCLEQYWFAPRKSDFMSAERSLL